MRKQLKKVAQGAYATVWVTQEVWDFIDGYDQPQHKATCQRHMKNFAAEGGRIIRNAEHFKNQGKFSVGNAGEKVTIWVFKAFQLRVYGGFVPGTKDFVCTRFERKKSNKAKSSVLEAAAKAVWELK